MIFVSWITCMIKFIGRWFLPTEAWCGRKSRMDFVKSRFFKTIRNRILERVGFYLSLTGDYFHSKYLVIRFPNPEDVSKFLQKFHVGMGFVFEGFGDLFQILLSFGGSGSVSFKTFRSVLNLRERKCLHVLQTDWLYFHCVWNVFWCYNLLVWKLFLSQLRLIRRRCTHT